jgi:hypothetical protein
MHSWTQTASTLPCRLQALDQPTHLYLGVRGYASLEECVSGLPQVLVALLTALPFAVAALSTVGNAWHSKRSGTAVLIPCCVLRTCVLLAMR